jgi:hypothetical protein
VTADQRVTDAREFIGSALPRHDVLLPASVLTRMFYELRRHALALLETLDARRPVTEVGADGSAALAPADLVEVLGALDHAAGFLAERAAQWCEDCARHPANACEAHVDDLDQAAAGTHLRSLRSHGRGPAMAELETLQAMIADLGGYIDRRAEDLAGPIVAQAEQDARDQVADAQSDSRRWKDLNGELRRRLKPLAERADEAAEARDTLARALGRHPAGEHLPDLVAEAIQRLEATQPAEDGSHEVHVDWRMTLLQVGCGMAEAVKSDREEWVMASRSLLDDSGAENYCVIDMEFPDRPRGGERYQFVLQRGRETHPPRSQAARRT